MTLPLQAAAASMSLFHIMDINTALLDKQGSILLLHERDRLPDAMLELQRQDYRSISIKTWENPDTCCLYTNQRGLSYASSLFRTGGSADMLVVVGPFLKQVPAPAVMDETLPAPQDRSMDWQQFYRSLKLISGSKIQSIANILEQAGSLRQAPLLYLEAERTGSAARGASVSSQPDDEASELIELRYRLENELMHAIEQGSRDKIKEMGGYAKNLYDFSERFPNQPIRALRNMLIVLNTLLRIAAGRGGVHPFYLHHLSEKFSKQIERSESIEALTALTESMYDEYCELARRLLVSGTSPLVRRAAHYLTVHMSKPLHLQTLAEHCLVHPAHVSRQFKKETGMTLTDFLNKQRIEEAKHLLKQERGSIDWIAGIVGFEDAGYFTRVFKKLTGVTPTQYRANEG
ncbi:helix-turn-helix domain-containing protein [Paenibacillus sp. TAB 01]|uniref:helix-turn-helix domain-containing protein n=1 Tax=Paenibacillus sp. TAB 01 TaxID=3368988 RepID=UPI00375023E7